MWYWLQLQEQHAWILGICRIHHSCSWWYNMIQSIKSTLNCFHSQWIMYNAAVCRQTLEASAQPAQHYSIIKVALALKKMCRIIQCLKPYLHIRKSMVKYSYGATLAKYLGQNVLPFDTYDMIISQISEFGISSQGSSATASLLHLPFCTNIEQSHWEKSITAETKRINFNSTYSGFNSPAGNAASISITFWWNTFHFMRFLDWNSGLLCCHRWSIIT